MRTAWGSTGMMAFERARGWFLGAASSPGRSRLIYPPRFFLSGVHREAQALGLLSERGCAVRETSHVFVRIVVIMEQSIKSSPAGRLS